MKALIIHSHPYDQSFNTQVVHAASEILSAKSGYTVETIDLVDDGFDPVMSSEDLKLWRTGAYHDKLAESYMEKLNQADLLIFPFPIWWGAMPAVLKGFCDKVLLPGKAYKYGEAGEMIGLLKGKRAVVVTTMQTPLEVFNSYFNNPVEGAFIKDTLHSCGVEVIKYFAFDQIVSGGREGAEEKLQEVRAYFNTL